MFTYLNLPFKSSFLNYANVKCLLFILSLPKLFVDETFLRDMKSADAYVYFLMTQNIFFVLFLHFDLVCSLHTAIKEKYFYHLYLITQRTQLKLKIECNRLFSIYHSSITTLMSALQQEVTTDANDCNF